MLLCSANSLDSATRREPSVMERMPQELLETILAMVPMPSARVSYDFIHFTDTPKTEA